MITIDPTLLIIMGEVILILLIAIIAASVFYLKRQNRDKEAVESLQGHLANDARKRREWFESVLSTTVQNGDEERNSERAASWVEKENQFYNRLINMYMERNPSALMSMDKLLHEYTSSYLELVTLMRDKVDEEQTELAKEVDALKEENERLSKELKDAYKEIEQASLESGSAARSKSDEAVMLGKVSGVASSEAEEESDVDMEGEHHNFDEADSEDLKVSASESESGDITPLEFDAFSAQGEAINQKGEAEPHEAGTLPKEDVNDIGGDDEPELSSQLEGLEEGKKQG